MTVNKTAYSWPAKAERNECIENLSQIFRRLGFEVVEFDPSTSSSMGGKGDILIVHWADAIFWRGSSTSKLVLLVFQVLWRIALQKARGMKLIWFIHNLAPHDANSRSLLIWKFYSHWISVLTDGWVVLTPSATPLVLSRFPRLKSCPRAVVWHPEYSDGFPEGQDCARQYLGLPKDYVLIGHVGAIRPYKGLVELAACLERTPGQGLLLFYGGAVRDDVRYDLKYFEELGTLVLFDKLLSEEEFDACLKSLDIFVAPLSDFLHSGSVVRALCRGVVVLAPRTAFTEDLAAMLGDEWVILYECGITGSDIARAEEAASQLKGSRPNLDFLDPIHGAESLGRLLEKMRST